MQDPDFQASLWFGTTLAPLVGGGLRTVTATPTATVTATAPPTVRPRAQARHTAPASRLVTVPSGSATSLLSEDDAPPGLASRGRRRDNA